MEQQLFTRDEARKRDQPSGRTDQCAGADQPAGAGAIFSTRYYGEEKSLLHRRRRAIATIQICDLSDAGGGAWAHTPPPAGRIAIDPVLGRIACGDAASAAAAGYVSLRLQRRHGGGEYDRAATLTRKPTADRSRCRLPTRRCKRRWRWCKPAGGVAEITDSGRYVETPAITAITATQGRIACRQRAPADVGPGSAFSKSAAAIKPK